jgi:hypothetical protein
MSTTASGAPLPLFGLALPELDDRHTFGTARVINLSSFPIGLNVSGRTYTGEARATDLVAPFPTGVAKLALAINDAQTWRPVLVTQRRLNPHTRIYTILVNRAPTVDNPEPVRPFVLFEYDRAPALLARNG